MNPRKIVSDTQQVVYEHSMNQRDTKKVVDETLQGKRTRWNRDTKQLKKDCHTQNPNGYYYKYQMMPQQDFMQAWLQKGAWESGK